MSGRIEGAGAAGAVQSRDQGPGIGKFQQGQQGFRDLASALQSGNLESAQKAFSALSSAAPNGIKADSPLGQIGQALEKGDLAGAQKTQAALQANRPTRQEGGGKVGNRPPPPPPPPPPESSKSAESSTTNSTQSILSGIGSLINTTA